MPKISLTTKQALRFAQIAAIGQGIALAIFIRRIEQATDRTHTKALFLAKFAQRNIDRLDEFEKIALNEMGMLGTPKENP